MYQLYKKIFLSFLSTSLLCGCYIQPDLPSQELKSEINDFLKEDSELRSSKVEKDELEVESNLSNSQRLILALPFSGNFQQLSQYVLEGAQFAIEEEYPDADLMDAPFTLIQEDTVASPQVGQGIIERVSLADPASIVIGPLVSNVSIAFKNTELENKIPFISFSKNKDFVPGGSAFRMAPTKSQEISSLLQEAVRHQALRGFAVIYPNTKSGNEYAETFRSELSAYGMKPAYDRSYFLHDNSQLLEIGSEIEDLNVRAVFFPDDLKVLNRLISSISEERRNRITFLGTPKWQNEDALLRSRNMLKHIMFVSPFYHSKSGKTKSFINKFEQRFQHKPHFLSAQTYDAMQLVFKAKKIQKQRNISNSNAIRLVKPFRGLTGVVRVRENGEIERKFEVVQLGNDGIESVKNKSSTIFTVKGNEKAVIGRTIKGDEN